MVDINEQNGSSYHVSVVLWNLVSSFFAPLSPRHNPVQSLYLANSVSAPDRCVTIARTVMTISGTIK